MAKDPRWDGLKFDRVDVMSRLYDAYGRPDPRALQHPSARWEMSLEFYRQLRLIYVISGLKDGEEPPTDAEISTWQISRGDMILGLPITEGPGDPVLVSDAPPSITLADYTPEVP